MSQTDTPVLRFLHAFARNESATDTSASASHFADTFMAVNPKGAYCLRAADFALAIPKRRQLFKDQGHRATTLISVEETPLDTNHVLARTLWRMIFDQSHAEPVEIDAHSIFILDTSSEPIKILFYLASQDPLELLARQTGSLE